MQRIAAKEYEHQDGCTYHIFVEDGHEARELNIIDLLYFFTVFLVSEQFLGKPVVQRHTKHLLMSQSKSGSVRNFLTRFDQEV